MFLGKNQNYVDKRKIFMYTSQHRNLGGFPMNDRNSKMISIYNSEAFSASFFGFSFFIFTEPVVKGDASRL